MKEKKKLNYTEKENELLKAIKKYGSINKAANELNRSYSHSQKKIRKLEKEFGKLIETKRGGRGGGGSELTERAKNLIKRYEKLETERKRVKQISITTWKGKVKEAKESVCIVDTSIGEIKAIKSEELQENDETDVLIREDGVIVRKTKEIDPNKTSARNRFRGTIEKIKPISDLVKLKIKIKDKKISITITEESRKKMDLRKNDEVLISFKAAATKAIKH